MVAESKDRISSILKWESDRKIVIVWPCSVDYEESFIEYGHFLKDLSEKVKDKIEIILRFYVWKPRTIGWWKGIVHSAPWEEANMWNWIFLVRSMALKALELWLPLADEMLNAPLIEYVDDYLSYIAIWARSTENQFHREVASWVDIPVWFKNPTSWNIAIMTNSIKAWQAPSHYILWNWIRDSEWNPLSHGILRWWDVTGPNYEKKFIEEYLNNSDNIDNPALIIDASHDNCRVDANTKDPLLQMEVSRKVFWEIIPHFERRLWKKQPIKWIMLESYIHRWNQKYINEESVIKWKSLTDPCISKTDTEVLISELYEML